MVFNGCACTRHDGLAISGGRFETCTRSNLLANVLRGKPIARLSVFTVWLCAAKFLAAFRKYAATRIRSRVSPALDFPGG